MISVSCFGVRVSDKIWLAVEMFMFESVNRQMHGRTDGRTPVRVPSYKLTL